MRTKLGSLGSRQIWISIALAAAVILQVGTTAGSYVRPFLDSYAGLRGRSSLDRGARLSFGDDFAGYILFLRRQVPADGLVIQPSFRQDQVFGHQGLMQYFLFPRHVMSCPREINWESCLAKFNGADTYFLSVGDFPPAFGPQNAELYTEYRPGRGLYGPEPGAAP